MDFNLITDNIAFLGASKLGGTKSHFKLVPPERKEFVPEKADLNNMRRAAVLALIYPKNNKAYIVLIKRARYQGVHSAQVSFPGGKPEKEDSSLYHTALRETYEEVGVCNEEKTTLLRELTQVYIPPSNFLVTPFLSFLNETPVFNKNHEVDEIIELALADLIDDKNIIIKNMSTSYMDKIDVPCFKINNQIIWGATAMVLSEIKDLLKKL